MLRSDVKVTTALRLLGACAEQPYDAIPWFEKHHPELLLKDAEPVWLECARLDWLTWLIAHNKIVLPDHVLRHVLCDLVEDATADETSDLVVNIRRIIGLVRSHLKGEGSLHIAQHEAQVLPAGKDIHYRLGFLPAASDIPIALGIATNLLQPTDTWHLQYAEYAVHPTNSHAADIVRRRVSWASILEASERAFEAQRTVVAHLEGEVDGEA